MSKQLGKNAVISSVDRHRLIVVFRDNRDWLATAETLNIKRQTALNIMKMISTRNAEVGKSL